MNKKIIVILILLILIISGAFLIYDNNKTTANKINQENTAYNEINSNGNQINYTSTLNTENQNTVATQDQKSRNNTTKSKQTYEVNSIQNENSSSKNDKEESKRVENIKITVNNNVLKVKIENNSSVDSLMEKLKQGDITIEAHEYGNYEKVGSLGFSLPTNDTQIKATVGDVMLYQGNQITIFYGSNSWNYTRLGRIVGISEGELKDILGTGNVSVVLSID